MSPATWASLYFPQALQSSVILHRLKLKLRAAQEPSPALIPVVAQSVSPEQSAFAESQSSLLALHARCKMRRAAPQQPRCTSTTEPPVWFERELVSLWPPLLAAPSASIAPTQQVSSPAANVSS